MKQRANTIAYWCAAPLLGLLIYWPGLVSWFQKDDFAWLGLRDMVQSWPDFWWALFAPLAQGTIRTLSERIFYMSFYSVFGLDALPYRLWAFLTYTATLVVLMAVCSRLTGSRAAAFWAAILWTANNALASALSWTAIYYQLACSFFLLLAFWFLLRFVDTGRRRYYVAQCVVFVLGFGVLEINVVYPALAAAFALCCAPRVLRYVLPLFLLSAAYTAVHMAVAPLMSSGPYKMYWNTSVFSTLLVYWKLAMGPSRLILFHIYPSVGRSALTAFLTLCLLGFVAWQLWRRKWIAAFFAAWFLIVLAPVLPLRDHVSDSYLTVPLLGAAMGAGWAVVCGWRAGPAARVTTAAALAIYLCVNLPLGRLIAESCYRNGQEARKLVLGVAALSRYREEKLVLLTGVSPDMFWSVISHRAMRLFGINEVFLPPEDQRMLSASERTPEALRFFIEPAYEQESLRLNHAVVYDVSGAAVRDITAMYRASRSAPP